MTSILHKALGAFVELDEDQKSPAPQVAASSTAAQVAPTSTRIVNAFDPDMLETLQKVIVNRKTRYTALVEAADKLRNFIPDENTRFKAAFAQISGDGQSTVDSITQALDVHINDISGELMRFKQTSDAAVATKVGVLRSTVKQIAAQQETRAQQIANLQTTIANLQQAVVDDNAHSTDLTNQANAAEAEIAAIAQKFQAAAEYLKQDLTNKKAQLTTALSA